MDKKIIHEVKLPRVITVALYAIAIGLLANVFKPVVMGHPAFAELNNYDNITVTHKFQSPLELSGEVAQEITVGQYSQPFSVNLQSGQGPFQIQQGPFQIRIK
ncbi:hypothetical protein N9413_11250 [Paracoccaceae bacterium]|nr:hypothetical protein [Paracoccaceae bacterium]